MSGFVRDAELRFEFLSLRFRLASSVGHKRVLAAASAMNHAEEFYPKLHASDEVYSAGEYHMKSLLSLRVVLRWGEEFRGRPMRLLDVGCGKGLFLRDFAAGMRRACGVSEIQGAGIDIVRSPGDHFGEVCPDFKFVQQNLDGAKLPFPDQSFDFVCCNQVLEHIFETEQLVREFRRVLSPNGLCVISVPNIAAWVNRITFLLGGQPLGSELGSESITYGFWPRFLQKRLVPFKPSGHIRDFTPRGLSDLASHCGFETAGWWPQSHGLVARLGKWAGRGIGIVLRPKRT
jgi:SAM-dependent methyltransferase